MQRGVEQKGLLVMRLTLPAQRDSGQATEAPGIDRDAAFGESRKRGISWSPKVDLPLTGAPTDASVRPG